MEVQPLGTQSGCSVTTTELVVIMLSHNIQGVPIRIEIGPRDLKQGQFVAVRRDNGEKSTLKIADAATSIPALLDNIHDSMFAK